jgi:hypothetical protein
MHEMDKNLRRPLVKVLYGRDHSEDVGISGRLILRLILKEYNGRVWIGFLCLGIGTNGELL